MTARPFVKWAGGKGQLLPQLKEYYPAGLENGSIEKYFEPFVGGGAMFFHIQEKYGPKDCHLFDFNEELILAYLTIRKNVVSVVENLWAIQEKYQSLSDDARKEYFYGVREDFNASKEDIDYDNYSIEWVKRTSQIIFLNRTCFNGLFRVNSKGGFNVPFGRYKNPQICNKDNLFAVSECLKNVTIIRGDFEISKEEINSKSLVYFDPPYRPISETASFTSYSGNKFGDKEQLRLAKYFRELDSKGAKLMLSNSDPKNIDPDDDFFEKAYRGFNLNVIQSNRRINSKGDKRGPINELIITNYGVGA